MREATMQHPVLFLIALAAITPVKCFVCNAEEETCVIADQPEVLVPVRIEPRLSSKTYKNQFDVDDDKLDYDALHLWKYDEFPVVDQALQMLPDIFLGDDAEGIVPYDDFPYVEEVPTEDSELTEEAAAVKNIEIGETVLQPPQEEFKGFEMMTFDEETPEEEVKEEVVIENAPEQKVEKKVVEEITPKKVEVEEVVEKTTPEVVVVEKKVEQVVPKKTKQNNQRKNRRQHKDHKKNNNIAKENVQPVKQEEKKEENKKDEGNVDYPDMEEKEVKTEETKVKEVKTEERKEKEVKTEETKEKEVKTEEKKEPVPETKSRLGEHIMKINQKQLKNKMRDENILLDLAEAL